MRADRMRVNQDGLVPREALEERAVVVTRRSVTRGGIMVMLEEITAKDVPAINRWRKDKELVSHLGATFRFINIETDKQWFENYLKDRGNQVRCGIYLRPRKLVGVVYLTHIDQVNRNAEFSIMLGEKKCWGKGIGSVAAKSMLEHGFKDLNLQRIYLYVVEDNKRAAGVYKKLGFRQEGILRKAVYKNGTYKNIFLMSVLKEEFLRK
jgi:RimJ/RimL family protein N-acetyltransferase